MPETNLETVITYLRQHGRNFDPEALREHLLAQGYDPALIDQAMTVYREEVFQTAQERGLPGVRMFLGCLGGLVTGVLSLLSLLFGVCDVLYGEGGKKVVSFIPFLIGGVLAVLTYYAVRPMVSKWRSR
jgi:hypothetical protein